VLYIVVKSKNVDQKQVDEVHRIIKMIRMQHKFDESTVLLHVYP